MEKIIDSIPRCALCSRFHSENLDLDRYVCDAFPGGIPGKILTGDVDHSKPYKGDHGLQYLPIA